MLYRALRTAGPITKPRTPQVQSVKHAYGDPKYREGNLVHPWQIIVGANIVGGCKYTIHFHWFLSASHNILLSLSLSLCYRLQLCGGGSFGIYGTIGVKLSANSHIQIPRRGQMKSWAYHQTMTMIRLV